MADKSLQSLSTHELFVIALGYVLNKWFCSKSFFDDIEEPRCMLTLQQIAKRLGVDFKEWINIIHEAYPEQFKEDIKLQQILKDIDF